MCGAHYTGVDGSEKHGGKHSRHVWLVTMWENEMWEINNTSNPASIPGLLQLNGFAKHPDNLIVWQLNSNTKLHGKICTNHICSVIYGCFKRPRLVGAWSKDINLVTANVMAKMFIKSTRKLTCTLSLQ